MVESGSSIQAFLNCPKLYWFKYVKCLEGRAYSSPLGFGTFFHAEVERFAGGRIDGTEQEYARFLSTKLQEYRQQIDIDRRLAERYFELWKAVWASGHPFDNNQFEWLAAEREWVFSLGESDDGLAGKSDGLVRHKPTGAIFLYELKTATDRDREGYVHRLELDRQVSANLLALKAEGIDAQGVLYDVAWKPAIRRLTGRKTKPDETPEEFADRMIQTVAENPPEFFQRQMIYRSESVLSDYRADLGLQFEAIHRARQKGFYRNTGSCNDFGRLCAFFGACVEGRSELLELYSVRDRKLPELSKETQCRSIPPQTSPTST